MSAPKRPLTTPRLWFYMDSLFHEQPVIQAMRDSFGPGGPYTLVVLLCEAYKRHFLRSTDSGVVDMTYASLAYSAGLTAPEEALMVLRYLADTGIVQPEGCAFPSQNDDFKEHATFRVRFLKWESWTPKDPGAAERKARSRARNEPSGRDVTVTSRDVTLGHTEVEIEVDLDLDPTAKSSRGDERPEVARLALLLADLIRRRDPKARVAPGSKGWLDAIRLLLDADERSEAEVEHVIRWCQADDFWRKNILSAPKLRVKFDQLYAKAGKPKGTADDFFKRNGM